MDLGRSMGRPAAGISRDAREWMLSHPWPGNVRELKNAIERAILLCDGGLITRDHLPKPVAVPDAAGENGHTKGANGGGNGGSETVHLGTTERRLIEQALSQAKGNKSKAARLLGLTRAQLYSRLEKYGISD
jgi:DNA-binding NtrC family response regulator